MVGEIPPIANVTGSFCEIYRTVFRQAERTLQPRGVRLPAPLLQDSW
jgi:hypothetical protein